MNIIVNDANILSNSIVAINDIFNDLIIYLIFATNYHIIYKYSCIPNYLRVIVQLFS